MGDQPSTSRLLFETAPSGAPQAAILVHVVSGTEARPNVPTSQTVVWTGASGAPTPTNKGPNDVFVVEGSGGGGSTVTADGTFTRIIAGSGESTAFKDAVVAGGGYACDGTADQVQINAALAAVGSETISRGGNGGKVILVGRNFGINDQILGPTQTILDSAYGKYATRVSADTGMPTGTNVGMIALATTNTQYFGVRGLTLDGNGRSVNGVFFNVGTGQEYDSFCTAEDLYIWNVGQAGLYTLNNSGGRLRGNMYQHIRIINAGTYGVWIASPDSFYHEIDTGSSGSHGWNIAHANNRITNSKAWYSDGSGFNLTTAGRDNQLAACESQDNQFHGYSIQGRSQMLSSCVADSNSYDGSPSTAPTGKSYHGFYVAGNYANIHGSATDKNEGSRGLRQQYGVYVASGLSGIIANVTTFQNEQGALGGPGAGTINGFVV